jgi:hypothetical protein
MPRQILLATQAPTICLLFTQIGVKLQGIKSAQKQVVAGLNYKLLLETDGGLYDATVYSEHLSM